MKGRVYLTASLIASYALGILFSFLSLMISKWSESKLLNGKFYTGLWKVCVDHSDDSDQDGCWTWSYFHDHPEKVVYKQDLNGNKDKLFDSSEIPPNEIIVMRLLAVLSVIFGCFFAIAVVVTMFKERNRILLAATGSTLLAAALFGLGEVLYTHNDYMDSKYVDKLANTDLSISWQLQVVAVAFLMLTFIIYVAHSIKKPEPLLQNASRSNSHVSGSYSPPAVESKAALGTPVVLSSPPSKTTTVSTPGAQPAGVSGNGYGNGYRDEQKGAKNTNPSGDNPFGNADNPFF